MKAAASSQRTADLTAAAGPAAAAALDSMRAGLADATRGALADEQEARRKAEQMGERIKLWLQSGMEEGAAGGSSRIVFSSQAERALPVIAQHARALRSAALDAASGVSMWEKTLVTAGVAAAKGQQRRELLRVQKRQQRERGQQQVREQLQVQLLLFYRKQPGQQQR